MPQVVQLTASLSIWVYPRDHARPHFHLIGPDTDAMVDTMKDDGEIVVVGGPLPRLVSIEALDGFEVAVTWEGGTRPGKRGVVDLAPAVFRYKIYAALRDDPALFRSVHVQAHRFGVAWGEDDTIDMGASMIEDLAAEAISAEDFSAFMARHGFTLDTIAAELGISRRMAAYYRAEHKVPRTVALACRYIDTKAASAASPRDMDNGT